MGGGGGVSRISLSDFKTSKNTAINTEGDVYKIVEDLTIPENTIIEFGSKESLLIESDTPITLTVDGELEIPHNKNNTNHEFKAIDIQKGHTLVVNGTITFGEIHNSVGIELNSEKTIVFGNPFFGETANLQVNNGGKIIFDKIVDKIGSESTGIKQNTASEIMIDGGEIQIKDIQGGKGIHIDATLNDGSTGPRGYQILDIKNDGAINIDNIQDESSIISTGIYMRGGGISLVGGGNITIKHVTHSGSGAPVRLIHLDDGQETESGNRPRVTLREDTAIRLTGTVYNHNGDPPNIIGILLSGPFAKDPSTSEGVYIDPGDLSGFVITGPFPTIDMTGDGSGVLTHYYPDFTSDDAEKLWGGFYGVGSDINVPGHSSEIPYIPPPPAIQNLSSSNTRNVEKPQNNKVNLRSMNFSVGNVKSNTQNKRLPVQRVVSRRPVFNQRKMVFY